MGNRCAQGRPSVGESAASRGGAPVLGARVGCSPGGADPHPHPVGRVGAGCPVPWGTRRDGY
jgi:hypothetical protein